MARDRQSKAIGDALRAHTADVAKALALEACANLRAAPDEGGTPVDTNHARANWLPSVGAPFTGEVDGAAAYESAVAAVLAYRLTDGSLFINNNAPYIDRLNLGSSKQAPAGFVEAAIDRAVQTVQSQWASSIDVATSGAGSFSDIAGAIAAGNIASAYSPFGDDA